MNTARGFGTVWLLRAALFVAVSAGGATHSVGLSAPEQAALDRISADSLRGNLSFLASDELEGRGTPSRGLDVAAEFIAAQFRRAGLEPVGKDGSYFQTANLVRVTPVLEGFQLTLGDGQEELELHSGDVRVRSVVALDLSDADVVRLPESGEGEMPAVRGKVVAGGVRRYGSEAALARLQAQQPALILLIGRRSYEHSDAPWLEERDSPNASVIRVASEAVADAMGEKRELRASLHLAAPKKEPVVARNVGGILRGSDPTLRDQYLLLTAHYDHLGMLPAGADRVFNGANDNGSGTVSVIEIASALATLPVHPKRSILFLALYGEEEGLLGSFFYTRHPLEPLRDTVADINLEQLGRTDELSGAQVGTFAFTGPSYSDLPAVMSDAAKREGVKIYAKHGADAYFDRSDNYAFALAGIVAHTIVVAFEYPDYHAAGDEWQKIDYPNLAKVDRGVAAGLLEVANRTERPTWSDSKEAAVYRNAAK